MRLLVGRQIGSKIIGPSWSCSAAPREAGMEATASQCKPPDAAVRELFAVAATQWPSL
jgi:hypothetical protein